MDEAKEKQRRINRSDLDDKSKEETMIRRCVEITV